MGRPLKIRDDLSPAELRALARRERDVRAAMRLVAIANALEGINRAESARLAGMERQALRDAVVRYNAEGVAGLHDRPHPGPRERLNEGQQAALISLILAGPDLARDGTTVWRLKDLCALTQARFGVSYTDSGMFDLLGRLGIAWMSVRPRHPQSDPKAQETFKKTSPPRFAPSVPPTPRRSASRSGSSTRAGSGRRAG